MNQIKILSSCHLKIVKCLENLFSCFLSDKDKKYKSLNNFSIKFYLFTNKSSK